MTGVIGLVGVQDTPVSVDVVRAAVADSRAGGIALFVGVVRDHDDGRAVTSLSYEAHPSAAHRMNDVAADVAAMPDVVAVAAVHRTGDLVVGDVAVVVAVSCAHRGDAFVACRTLIDRIKDEVPIWKHQQFADGTAEWVACGVSEVTA